jgi:sugar lactone lactonase YvrE
MLPFLLRYWGFALSFNFTADSYSNYPNKINRRNVMKSKSLVIGSVISFMIILGSNPAIAAKIQSADPSPVLITEGLEGSSGSTIGSDGALYVTEGAVGRISRIDPQTGDISTFASGLPEWIIPLGGAIDVAFIDETAYVLVTLVGDPVIGGEDVVGIYRVDSSDSFTVIADIGQFSIDNPPDTDFFLPTGVQYALETFRGGFLVTDGHHNRVLRVTLDGEVTEMIEFDNIVPTGLEVHGKTVYMAEAGPNPHLPKDGKVVAFGPKSLTPTEVAFGAPLLVDVEYGLGRTLYALSQGDFEEGNPDGSPALPDTGSLVEVNKDGSFTVITEGLDRPTSLELIGNTAYVVTLTGEVWKIEGVSDPPYGASH